MFRTSLGNHVWVVGALLGFLHCTSGNPEYPDAAACEPGDRQCSMTANRPVALVCGRDASDRAGKLDCSL